jgi:DNA helicase TIP49 (TBP-interacting protein)
MRTLKPSAINIGALDDKIISQSREIFKRQGSVKREESEPFDNFIKNCNKMKIVPSPMGVVNKNKEINEVIKLNEYKIGDEYANIFATSFKKSNQKILHLNMRNNKLSDKGAHAIIDNLTEFIITIDMSWNPKISLSAYE